MTIEILLVDDQDLMLEGIKAILKHEPGIKIVGTAKDGQSAIAQVIKLRPDIVLIDIEMPRMNGIVAIEYICHNLPHTRAIVLSSHKEQNYVDKALQAGASGYLLKNTLIQDLKQAIYAFGRGYSYVESQSSTQNKRISPSKIASYKKRITYLQKHRKSIYKPSSGRASQKSQPRVRRQIFTSKSSAASGISKASLAPIFDFKLPATTPDSFPPEPRKPQNRPLYSQPKFNRQRYLRRIALMLMAIVSFILSIIIF